MPTCKCGSEADYVGLNDVSGCTNPKCPFYGTKTDPGEHPIMSEDKLAAIMKMPKDMLFQIPSVTVHFKGGVLSVDCVCGTTSTLTSPGHNPCPGCGLIVKVDGEPWSQGDQRKAAVIQAFRRSGLGADNADIKRILEYGLEDWVITEWSDEQTHNRSFHFLRPVTFNARVVMRKAHEYRGTRRMTIDLTGDTDEGPWLATGIDFDV